MAKYLDATGVSTLWGKIKSSFASTGHNHDGRYLQYDGWWTSGNGNNADNATGMVFAYSDHNVPTGWGILTTFEWQHNSSYRMQLFSYGYSNGYTYYRNRSADRNGWNDWVRFLDSTNYTDYAASASHTHPYLPLSGGTITDSLIIGGSDIPEVAGNLSSYASLHSIKFYRNGFLIPYQMENTNDGGFFRVRGTTEDNVVCEIGTWDDYGIGETIQFNYYPTTSTINPTYSVSVPKATGTLALTSQIPTNNNQLTNGAGYITSSGSCNYANSAGVATGIANGFKRFEFYAGKTYIGWVSIAKLQLNTSNQYDYNSFNLYICRSYNSPSSESYAINITIGWEKATVRLLSKSVGTQIINKCRIALDSSNHILYLQVYVNTSYTTYQNGCTATLVGIVSNNWSTDNTVNNSPEEVASYDLASGTYADSAGLVPSLTNSEIDGIIT